MFRNVPESAVLLLTPEFQDGYVANQSLERNRATFGVVTATKARRKDATNANRQSGRGHQQTLGGSMSRKNGSKNGLGNPSTLAPVASDDKEMLRVVIETPKGSRNKFAFDSKERIFQLKKVLPCGMMFPYSFGFIPSTKGDDGDPLDVLVLMDEPVFPGCVLTCRPIGVIEGEQGSGKDMERNDRILAIEQDSHQWADIKTVDDLGNRFCKELEQFFEDYHKLSKQQYRVLDVKGPNAAWKLVKNGQK